MKTTVLNIPQKVQMTEREATAMISAWERVKLSHPTFPAVQCSTHAGDYLWGFSTGELIQFC